MITYNHENLIKDAVEGVLMQKADFEIELIIADDNSPDKTEDVIHEIASKHPNGKWIKYTKHKANKGVIPNFIWALQQCQSEYIAICEGDDYWTDPYKLQKQVDFLKKNPNYSLCFHKVKILNIENQLLEDVKTKVPKKHNSINALAKKGNYIHTPSVVFKNYVHSLPETFIKSPIGDFFLHMVTAQYGKLFYMNEEMAVYREGVGIWSKHNNQYRIYNTCKCFALVAEYYLNNNFRVTLILLKRIKKYSRVFNTSEKIKLYNSLLDIIDARFLKFLFSIKLKKLRFIHKLSL